MSMWSLFYFLSRLICIFQMHYIREIIAICPLVSVLFHWVCFHAWACCRMYQNSDPFPGWILFHCMYIPHSVYSFICWRTSGLLPPPWLLWLMLPWTFVCKDLFESLLPSLWGIFLEVELPDHLVIIYLTIYLLIFGRTTWHVES